MKRFNKTNGMYALLIAVATMIGITIYGSCSADEDYDGFSSRDELFTLADGEMNLRSEDNPNPSVEIKLETDLRTDTVTLQIDDPALNANITNKTCLFHSRYIVKINKRTNKLSGEVKDVSMSGNWHFENPMITIEKLVHNNQNSEYRFYARFSAMVIGHDNNTMGRCIKWVHIPESLFH